MKNYFLSSLIALVLILTQSTSIADQCNYRTQTITENGVIVQRTEVKTCEETIDLNKKNFVVEFMTDEEFENMDLKTAIKILKYPKKLVKYKNKPIIVNRSKNGFFSKKDMVANSFGIVFASVIISS